MHETFKQTIFFVADTKLTLVCKSLTFVTAHEQQQNQKRNKDSHTSATWTRYFSSYYLVHSCVTLRFWLMHNVQQTETWIYQRRAIRCVYFSSFISISILSPNRHTRHGIRTFVRCWSLWLNKKNLQLDEMRTIWEIMNIQESTSHRFIWLSVENILLRTQMSLCQCCTCWWNVFLFQTEPLLALWTACPKNSRYLETRENDFFMWMNLKCYNTPEPQRSQVVCVRLYAALSGHFWGVISHFRGKYLEKMNSLERSNMHDFSSCIRP